MTNEILECGHPPTEQPIGSCTVGYGQDASGARYCFTCCTARDLAAMDREGHIMAYLSGDGKHITNWPGSALLTVTREWATSAGGFCRREVITRVWAVDASGQAWYGRGPGRGSYIRMHRSAVKRRAA